MQEFRPNRITVPNSPDDLDDISMAKNSEVEDQPLSPILTSGTS